MNKTATRAWSKPELIVIVRGAAEEAVLSGCKTNAGGGAASQRSSCNVDNLGRCGGTCDRIASS